MVSLSRPYPVEFFKGCYSQILLGSFLTILSQLISLVQEDACFSYSFCSRIRFSKDCCYCEPVHWPAVLGHLIGFCMILYLLKVIFEQRGFIQVDTHGLNWAYIGRSDIVL